MSEAKNPESDVWSCRDIASHAGNWTLACDVNLLKHLEAFSDRILEGSQAIDGKLNDLFGKLDETALSLDLARNEFSSLSNVQFIESRIYEEDETINEEKLEKTDDCLKNDEVTKEDLKEAALRGVAVLEKYFEKVEVPGSDSEDEGLPNFVLRPKDPYIHRPLPYVIGTDEWYKSTTAGILDSSSDSEVERTSDKYSDDSELDGERGTREGNTRSVTESEISEGELSNKLERPVANSTFNNTTATATDDFFDSVSQYNSARVQAPISQSLFAEQLAQKLGNVINANEPEVNVNTRPIQKHNNYGQLFSNEPPPIDNDDKFINKNTKGIFSGGDGLFDDLEDDVSFWGGEPKKSEEKHNEIDNQPINQKVENKKPNNLFDESNSTDDELFPPIKHGKEVQKPKKLTLFDDDSQSSDDTFTKTNNQRNTPVIKKKPVNLFDEDSDNSDGLFGAIPKSKAKTSSNLFDAEDIFNNNPKGADSDAKIDNVQSNVSSKIEKPLPNLFSDSDSDSDDLFSPNNPSLKPKIISITKPEKSVESNESNEKEIVDSPKKLSDEPEKKRISLFDEEDDLFLPVEKAEVIEEEKHSREKEEDSAPILFEPPPYIFEDIPSTNNIFDDVSPPSEESDPTPKTNSLFDAAPDEEPWNNEDAFLSEHRSSIFDDEPPSLSYNESSGIVREPTSTRVETDVSSFYPCASSSRRLSADAFGAYSEDSLLSSKVKPENRKKETANEITDESITSYIDITPSGKLSELYSEATENLSKPRKTVTFEENIKIFDESTGEPEKVEAEETDGNKLGIPKKPIVEEQPDKEEEKVLPGKLNRTVNINVQALLPGGGPMRRGLTKPERPASVGFYEDSQVTSVGIPRVNSKLLKPQRSVEERRSEDVEVLPSITKTRARIPHRRPSTKRGREAFRNSYLDLATPTNEEIVEEIPDERITPDGPKSIEEGLDRLTTRTTAENKKSFVESDNFASPEFNKPDLFDEDDLFSVMKLPPKSKILKRNLFDDDDDDIDFFQSISQQKKTIATDATVQPAASTRKPKMMTTTPNVKKLENIQVTEDDPLNAFER